MIAIVLGSSAAALNSSRAAQAFLKAYGQEALIVCVNDAIKFCPVKPDAFCTVQGGNVPLFLRPEVDMGGVMVYTRRRVHGVASRIVRPRWLGTSGLYAVQIALEELGCDGVILAGCPMSAAAGTLAPEHSLMTDPDRVERYKPEWRTAMPAIAGRTRSMSGWTRELLGEPDNAWIDQLNALRSAANMMENAA